MDMLDQFLALADAFEKLDSKTRALVLSQDIFGDGASEIVRILQGGSEEIKKWAKEADELGITIETKAAKEARAFREELAKLEMMLRKFQQVIITELGPAIRDLATWLIDAAKAVGDFYDKFALHHQIGPTTLESLQYAYAQTQSAMNTFIETAGQGSRAVAESMPAYQRMATRLATIAGAMKFYKDQAARPDPSGLLDRDKKDASGETWLASEVDTQFPELHNWSRERAAKLRSRDHTPDWVRELDAEVEASNRRMAKLAEEYQKKLSFMQSLADQAARGIQSAMADFFFDPFEDGLDGMLKKFIDVIRRMIAEWLAFQTLSFFGIGNFFSGMVGARAAGGHVTAGKPYLVGERGPELFMPGASGTVIPNGKGGMGGMNFVTNIDARGADPGLIARLPQIMDNRDRRLMMKMKDYMDTGSLVI
jgi:hypothetical protein